MRKRDKALVPYKTCPRCGGTGEILCTGREYYQKLSHDWAASLHGRAVTVPFFKGDRHGGWTRVPGLAIAAVEKGGWGILKVYISVDKYPNWGHFNLQLYGYDERYDVINDHKLYYLTKGRPAREDVIPIDINAVRPSLKEVMQLLQQNLGNEVESYKVVERA